MALRSARGRVPWDASRLLRPVLSRLLDQGTPLPLPAHPASPLFQAREQGSRPHLPTATGPRSCDSSPAGLHAGVQLLGGGTCHLRVASPQSASPASPAPRSCHEGGAMLGLRGVACSSASAAAESGAAQGGRGLAEADSPSSNSSSSSSSGAASPQAVGTAPRRRRPYVRAHGAAVPGESGAYAVLLDGRELTTPAKQPVRLPSLALAYAVAAEWEWQQGLKLRPYTMPLMKLTATAMDQMPRDREKVVHSLVQFFHTDQVLVRQPDPDTTPADSPSAFVVPGTGDSAWGPLAGLESIKGAYSQHLQQLCDKQRELWDPLLALLSTGLGVEAEPSSDYIPPLQSAAAVAALEQHLNGLDNWHLTAVDSLASSARSVAIGLLLSRGLIDVPGAMAAARLEEDFQIASAGFVEGGHDIDLADLQAKLLAPVVFLKLLDLE